MKNKSNIRDVSIINSKNRMNKRGAEMTIGTIVIIVLAIAVLVFLIFGFTTGWTNLWGKITILGGGSATINEVSQACAIACAQQDNYGWNTLKWTVRDEKGLKIEATCDQLASTAGVILTKGKAPTQVEIDLTLTDDAKTTNEEAVADYVVALKKYNDAGVPLTGSVENCPNL